MPYSPPARVRSPKEIKLTQRTWPKGYISTLADSRMPLDAFADMTNMELDQDSIPRPRPPLVAYGPALPGPCIGAGTFHKIVSGAHERWQIFMCVVGGAGKIYIGKDGGSLTEIGGSYDTAAWVTFTQSNNRVYVSNGEDTMSYYDINLGTIVEYTALATPATPTAAGTGLTGTNFTYYYRITANNAVGETAASVADTEQVSLIRDQWNPATQYIDVSWAAVTGATSYNIYVGTAAGSEQYLTTVTGLTYKDDGSQVLNPFKVAPAGDSTAGPKLKRLINRNGQLFGVQDTENPSYMWYSGTGEQSGDFSPFNGGGFVAIDYGGDTLPVGIRSFRDGRGNPVVTVLSRGAAGMGKMNHITFDSQTLGDTIIIFPNVYEANGQAGTVSPMAVIEANNSLYYPTGSAFKSTGTRANIVNILATDNISQDSDPDVRRLNLAAMEGAVGQEYENRLFFALPVASSTNNEIWLLDLNRKGAWILRWPIAVKYMWLYEDNSGNRHFCVLNYDDEVLEFDFDRSSGTTHDNSVGWDTQLAGSSITFGDSGLEMASIEIQRFKFLYPRGTITSSIFGLGEDEEIATLGSGSFSSEVSFTGFDQLLYDNAETSGLSVYDGDIGIVEFYSQAVAALAIEIDEIVNELKWVVTTSGINCDYYLSAVHTKGVAISGLYLGD